MTTSFEGWGVGGGGRVDSNSFIIIPKLNSLPILTVVTNSKFIYFATSARQICLLSFFSCLELSDY